MRADNSTTSHLGLMITTAEYWTSYKGTRDELLDEGICVDECFPEGRKRLKNNFDEPKSNGHWSMRRIKGGMFNFTLHHDRKVLPQERGSEYESLDAWQASQDNFIGRLLRVIDMNVTGEAEKLAHGETTIHFDATTQKRIKAAANEMESALRCGGAIWTGKARWAKRKLPAAKQDKGFQTFLSDLTK